MIIGLEGVSCTGKTTLARALANRLGTASVVPCYYHVAPDPSLLPNPIPDDEREQLASMEVLLGLEALRRDMAHRALDMGRVVILDRTVDTLLAHTYAIDRLRGLSAAETARILAIERPTIVPDITLLLVTTPTVLAERAARRPGMPSIFYDPIFTTHFNAYFERPLVPRWVHLDAAQCTEDLAAQALAEINEPAIAATANLEVQ